MFVWTLVTTFDRDGTHFGWNHFEMSFIFVKSGVQSSEKPLQSLLEDWKNVYKEFQTCVFRVEGWSKKNKIILDSTLMRIVSEESFPWQLSFEKQTENTSFKTLSPSFWKEGKFVRTVCSTFFQYFKNSVCVMEMNRGGNEFLRSHGTKLQASQDLVSFESRTVWNLFKLQGTTNKQELLKFLQIQNWPEWIVLFRLQTKT